MTDKEQQLREKYGEKGLSNLKAHATLLNMSLEQMFSLVEINPTAFLEMLQSAMLKKRETDVTEPPRRLTFVLPKRRCANKKCPNFIAPTSKYTTCCYRCHLAVQAELEAIEAGDKEKQERPF